jgi:uncharacterized protein (DUF488 family)
MPTLLTVFTIGHSTRELEEFLEILRVHHIEEIVDVRRYPGSKRYPQFGSDALRHSLADAGIRYRHEPDMGGRRTAGKDSPHTAWRSASFRAYADHMETPTFHARLDVLIEMAAAERQAIMCAEAVPWRCHRQLISDALTARGVEVCHILGKGRADRHELNPHAVITVDGGVAYPGSVAESSPAAGQTELPLG